MLLANHKKNAVGILIHCNRASDTGRTGCIKNHAGLGHKYPMLDNIQYHDFEWGHLISRNDTPTDHTQSPKLCSYPDRRTSRAKKEEKEEDEDDDEGAKAEPKDDDAADDEDEEQASQDEGCPEEADIRDMRHKLENLGLN